MTPPVLPPAFLSVPIAHRALHDMRAGRPENALSAVRAAVAAGYGIEIDLQLSSDAVPMVIHDPTLERTTSGQGPVRAHTARELDAMALRGGTGEGVATLEAVLAAVAGKVPLLLELKDTDGGLGPGVGALEAAVAGVIAGYDGPVAVMSFNPHSVAAMAARAPRTPRGLVTCAFAGTDFPGTRPERLAELAAIPDYARVGACFVSHHCRDLDNPLLAGLRGRGAALLCWTIRSPQAEAQARKRADNITFEGYRPAL